MRRAGLEALGPPNRAFVYVQQRYQSGSGLSRSTELNLQHLSLTVPYLADALLRDLLNRLAGSESR